MIDVTRYRFDGWTIALVRDWPDALLATEKWVQFSLPVSGSAREHPDAFSLVLDMSKISEPPPRALMGLSYLPGVGNLRVEIPIAPFVHNGEGNTFVGPLGERFNAGWSAELTGPTALGLIDGLGPVSTIAGTVRLAYAGEHTDTSPMRVRTSFTSLLCSAFLARVNGDPHPEGWIEVSAADLHKGGYPDLGLR